MFTPEHQQSPEREERERIDTDRLCADLHARIAETRELTRRSRDLLRAVAGEARSFAPRDQD